MNLIMRRRPLPSHSTPKLSFVMIMVTRGHHWWRSNDYPEWLAQGQLRLAHTMNDA